jgi:hypothetical protein
MFRPDISMQGANESSDGDPLADDYSVDKKDPDKD